MKKGIIAYMWGTSGKSINNIVPKIKDDYVAMSYGKKRRNWRLNDDNKRVYMRNTIHESPPIYFRFGYRGYAPGNVVDIMPTAPMRLVGNKYEFRCWAQENDIPTPKTWRKGNEPNNIEYPILGRPRRHSIGCGYYVINTPLEYNVSRHYYYQELHDKEAEYRVYTAFGYVWCVSKKNPREGVSPKDNWNFSDGKATFKIQRIVDYNMDVVMLALNLVYKLDLWFAATDIIVVSGKPYVLEVNTAPGISGKLKPENLSKILLWLLDQQDMEKMPAPDKTQFRHPALQK